MSLLLAASSGYTLTVDKGEFNLVGDAANLLYDRVIVTDKGEYVLTGNSVSFQRSYILAVNKGSYALTGNDVNLTLGSETTSVIAPPTRRRGGGPNKHKAEEAEILEFINVFLELVE